MKKYTVKKDEATDIFRSFLKSVKISQFQSIPVIHCKQSYGIVLQHKSGVKISYSGDTRPCELFSQAASGSTLLIHEATYPDNLRKEAIKGLHCTEGEAIDMFIIFYLED
jgi:ribonuclease Z